VAISTSSSREQRYESGSNDYVLRVVCTGREARTMAWQLPNIRMNPAGAMPTHDLCL
jgi:hypothetical protein